MHFLPVAALAAVEKVKTHWATILAACLLSVVGHVGFHLYESDGPEEVSVYQPPRHIVWRIVQHPLRVRVVEHSFECQYNPRIPCAR